MKRQVLLVGAVLLSSVIRAEITVSDVTVFSGYPWNEVVVGYTITGTDDDADAIRLTATDKVANKSYTVEAGSDELIGAELTEGRHVIRWKAAAQGVKFSSTNVVFSVSVVDCWVQLWENGPLWRDCNVGATNPEEYGYYFWWGDTVGYKRNATNDGWVSVKDGSSFSFKSGNCPTYDMSNSALKTQGYVDVSGNLVAEYDAATAHLGAQWRIPTDAEISSLVSNCTTTWTTHKGVYGQLVTGKGVYASKAIFLPAAGNGCYGSDLYGAGSGCYYWSSTPNSNNSGYAFDLCFNSGELVRGQIFRDWGLPVRPVRGFAK